MNFTLTESLPFVAVALLCWIAICVHHIDKVVSEHIAVPKARAALEQEAMSKRRSTTDPHPPAP